MKASSVEFLSASPVKELMRPRPQGASCLSEVLSAIEKSRYRGRLLSDSGLGMTEAILLDGDNVGVRSQSLNLGVIESTSEAIDEIPLVGDSLTR